jgi:hypothetical protein
MVIQDRHSHSFANDAQDIQRIIISLAQHTLPLHTTFLTLGLLSLSE